MDATIYSTTQNPHFFANLETAVKALEDAGFIYQDDLSDFHNGMDANGRMTFIAPAGFFPSQLAYIGFHKLVA